MIRSKDNKPTKTRDFCILRSQRIISRGGAEACVTALGYNNVKHQFGFFSSHATSRTTNGMSTAMVLGAFVITSVNSARATPSGNP